MFVAAISATALVIVILALVKPLENRLFRRQQTRRVIVLIDRQRSSLAHIEAEIEATGLTIREMTLRRGDAPGEDSIDFALQRGAPRAAVADLISRLQTIEGVRGVTV